MLKDKIKARRYKEIELYGERVAVRLFTVKERETIQEQLENDDSDDMDKLAPFVEAIVDVETHKPLLEMDWVKEHMATQDAMDLMKLILQNNGVNADEKKS